MSVELIKGISLGIELLEDEDLGTYFCIEFFFFRFMFEIEV